MKRAKTTERITTEVKKGVSDIELMCALIDQVMRAVPSGGTESNVVTRISRPLWRRWCRATGSKGEPTEWKLHGCRRVFGSKTIVFKSDKLIAWSKAIK